MSETSFSTQPDPVLALPPFYRAIFPAATDRRDWLTIKLGWLLCDTWRGPFLVFAEDDVRARLLDEYFIAARARVNGLIKSGATRDPSRRGQYGQAIQQLRRAHAALVKRALGYTWAGERDLRGRPAVWVFQ